MDELNDLFDCAPIIQIHTPEHGFTDVSSRVSDTFYSGMGQISFCRSFNAPLLWAHYADSHRGVCLGFDIDGALNPVRYTKSKKRVRHVIREGQDTESTKKSLVKCFATKEAAYAYEEEVRMFVPFQLAHEHAGIVKFPYNFNTLKRVIVGARFNGDLAAVRAIVPMAIRIERAFPHAELRQIDVEPLP